MVNAYALAFLLSESDILLLHRKDAVFGNNLYSLPGGKVEQGETARQAIVREVQEELGLNISESNFQLEHTFHCKGTETEFIACVFKADISGLAPINNEPHKHDNMQLFNLEKLPENIIPSHKQAIECIVNDIRYSEHGW